MLRNVRRAMVFVAAAVLGIGAAGCSTSEKFSAAAGPLTEQITGEARGYALRLEEPAKTEETDRANGLSAAVAAGDRQAALPLWFGDPPGEGAGVRGFYLASLDSDPLLQGEDGQTVHAMLVGNVGALDYIMRVGQARPPPGPATSPARVH